MTEQEISLVKKHLLEKRLVTRFKIISALLWTMEKVWPYKVTLNIHFGE